MCLGREESDPGRKAEEMKMSVHHIYSSFKQSAVIVYSVTTHRIDALFDRLSGEEKKDIRYRINV